MCPPRTYLCVLTFGLQKEITRRDMVCLVRCSTQPHVSYYISLYIAVAPCAGHYICCPAPHAQMNVC